MSVGRGLAPCLHRQRYFYFVAASTDETTEDTRFDEDEDETRSYDDSTHRHYDPVMETVAPGTKYLSSKSIPSARRRQHNRLAVSRTPFIQPVFGEHGKYEKKTPRLLQKFGPFC